MISNYFRIILQNSYLTLFHKAIYHRTSSSDMMEMYRDTLQIHDNYTLKKYCGCCEFIL